MTSSVYCCSIYYWYQPLFGRMEHKRSVKQKCGWFRYTVFSYPYLYLNTNSFLRRKKESIKLKSFLLQPFILGMTVVAQLARKQEDILTPQCIYQAVSFFRYSQILEVLASSIVSMIFFSLFFREDYLECLSSDNVLWSSVFFQSIFFPELPLEMKFHLDSSVPSDEVLHSQF